MRTDGVTPFGVQRLLLNMSHMFGVSPLDLLGLCGLLITLEFHSPYFCEFGTVGILQPLNFGIPLNLQKIRAGAS